MTDKMMLASMFAAAVAVIALVAILCMTIPGKRSRPKRAPATRVEIRMLMKHAISMHPAALFLRTGKFVYVRIITNVCGRFRLLPAPVLSR